MTQKKLGPFYKDGKQVLDVGDSFTSFCRQFNKQYNVLPNTHNDKQLYKQIKDNRYKNFNVDRCVINNEVISMHLGRGTVKALNIYSDSGKVMYDDWLRFCNEVVL